MILQALYRLAQQEKLIDDPDYEYKPVAWLVRLRPDGTLINIEGTHEVPPAEGKRKPKPVPMQFRIPRQPTGRSGTKAPPAFLVDNAKYVFGLPTADKEFDADEGREKSGWFRDLVTECAEQSGDEGAKAVLTFLDRIAKGKQKVELDPETRSNDLFAFLIGTGVEFVHERPKVVAYWKAKRAAGGAARDGAPGYRCLVTGEVIHEPVLFPLAKGLPGASTSGASLVGFNQRAFESHGWGGNENAPISRAAAEAVATALNRLLAAAPQSAKGRLPRRNVRLTDDTALVYWTTEADAEEYVDALGDALTPPEDPEKVGELVRSIWKGRAPRVDGSAPFYALILSGAQGRAVVRDWIESTVPDLMAAVARHFADLAIVRNTVYRDGGPPPAIPLAQLLESLAPGGKRENVPDPLAAELVHAALRGTTYPLALFQRALLRERAEAGRDEWVDSVRRDARAAIVKGVLIRHFKLEVTTAMDDDSKSPGYRLGRLMAVLEDAQRLALGRNVNATVKDKFYGAASATPAAVFPAMMDLFHKHCRKAREERPGAVVNREKLADEILAGVDRIPAHLPLPEQGMFVLGYHHQRHALFNKPAEPGEHEGDGDSEAAEPESASK